jgi:hypothetical protein
MSKARPTSRISSIIIHCADTPNGAYRCAEDIDDWHGERQPHFSRGLLAIGAINVSTHLKHVGYHYDIDIELSG